MNKPPKIFVIADTHFSHKKMEEVGRPKNFNDIIIKNWNSLVRSNDIVIHLGDVIFSRASELSSINKRLNGIKILVKGNHDKNKFYWYMERGFNFCCDAFRLDNIYFTHEPTVEIPSGCLYNVHGHIHNGGHRCYVKKDFNILINIEGSLCPRELSKILPS